MLTMWLVTLLIFSVHLTTAQNNVYWEHYGNDVGGSKYSPLSSINRSNVSSLQVAWTYRWGENPFGPEQKFAFQHQAVPLMVDDGSEQGRNLLIFPLAWRRIVALDADTGEEVWINDDGVMGGGGTCRGVATWLDPDKAPGELCRRMIYMPTKDLRLMAIDGATGLRCPQFGTNGFIDISVPNSKCAANNGYCYWFSNPPAVVRNTLALGAGTSDFLKDTPKGRIPGYDARTGALLWTFWIIPTDPADPAMSTWLNGTENMGSGNAWAPLSGDEELGLFYVPTSEGTGEHQAMHRPGDNHYTSGLVALNATSGERVWFQQFVHHDIWDYDTNSQPSVGEITKDGQRRKVVIQGTKMGFVFVMDALTGEYVYEVEERAVKQSTVPGEQTSPTQPFPRDDFLIMAPTSLNLTEGAELWGGNATEKQLCKLMLQNITLEAQIFDPAEVNRGTIWVPGNNGGQNLSGVSLDKKRGVLVAPVNHHPGISGLVPQGTNESEVPAWCDLIYSEQFPYSECVSWGILGPSGAPCHKPVWTRMLAVDLNAGRTLWDRPLGYIPPFPESYGSRWHLGSVLVTAGDLIFAGNTEDFYFRAYDIETGDILWQSPEALPAQSCGAPITYRSNGKQYLTVLAGGCEKHKSTNTLYRSDLFQVYSLP